MKRWPALFVAGAATTLLLVGLSLAQTNYYVPPNQAVIVVRLPASATLTIGGAATTQKGAVRSFNTPDLVPGFEYSYEVEASWKEGDKPRAEKRTVKFTQGKVTVVEFSAGPEKITQPKKVDPSEKPKKLPMEEPKKVEPKKVEPKKVEPKKVEPKKVEPKKVDPTKVEPKKVEPKKVEPNKTEKVEPSAAKARTFKFTYAGAVKDLKPGQQVSVWLPVADDTAEQDITLLSKKLPGKDSLHQEKEYGNKMIYFQAKADKDGKVPFEVVYQVARKEVRTDLKANATLKPRPDEKISRFLEADKLVPISGKPLELIKDKKLPGDQFQAAKQLYDVVNEHMKYDKSGKGWGRGDAEWACDSKFGNCTDFHSLFISMARGNKIPSKFEMGFPVPPKRGAGPIGGYHCWAWFMPNKKGWIPVDISEANRFPEMRDYYFGNLTEDRVQFTTGRDIDLEPRQKGPSLNFFIHPYAEVDGQPYSLEKIDRSYSYEDLP